MFRGPVVGRPRNMRRSRLLLPERIEVRIDPQIGNPESGILPEYGNVDRTVHLEIHHRHDSQSAERLPHGGVENLPDGLFVVELDLGLLRMHIHVDPLRIDRQIQKVGRLRIGSDQFLVSLQDRLAEIGRTEITAVDEQVLLPVRFFGGRRTADESFDPDDRSIGAYFEQIFSDILAADRRNDPLAKVRSGQRSDQHIVVVQ